jgi:hypothetical protein
VLSVCLSISETGLKTLGTACGENPPWVLETSIYEGVMFVKGERLA